jgi:hypothetical protein
MRRVSPPMFHVEHAGSEGAVDEKILQKQGSIHSET